MYRVVHKFWDMEDKTKHEYRVGDEFPFDGRKITKKRIEELSSKENKIGQVLIELVDESTDGNSDDDSIDNNSNPTDLDNDDNNSNGNLDDSNKDDLNNNE